MKTSSNAVRCEPVLTRWLLATIIVLVTLTLPVEVGRAAESRSRTDSGPLAGALGNGIRITAIHATGRNPIKEFWVIAGTRPQVGGEQAKEVVNWQPHTLRAGHEGELIWPLDKAYDEMALRVEADGYAPQVMAWLEKKKAPQNIVFELRENREPPGAC